MCAHVCLCVVLGVSIYRNSAQLWPLLAPQTAGAIWYTWTSKHVNFPVVTNATKPTWCSSTWQLLSVPFPQTTDRRLADGTVACDYINCCGRWPSCCCHHTGLLPLRCLSQWQPCRFSAPPRAKSPPVRGCGQSVTTEAGQLMIAEQTERRSLVPWKYGCSIIHENLNFPFKLWPKVSLSIIHKCILYLTFYGNYHVQALCLLQYLLLC